MIYTLLAVMAGVVMVGGFTDERTIGGGTSGLAQLINPGPQGPYPPSPPAYNYATADNGGFTVQSGYEGFILPTGPAREPHSALHALGGFALGAGLLSHLLPFPFNKIALAFTTKLGLWLLGFLLLLLLGGATTTAVCALTPLCTISFLGLGFNRESTRSLLSQDRINAATQFVHDAIEKYQNLQSRSGKAAKAKKAKEEKKTKEDSEVKEDKLVKEGREAKSIKEFEDIRDVVKSKDAVETTISEYF